MSLTESTLPATLPPAMIAEDAPLVPAVPRQKIGEYLIEKGLISRAALNSALLEQSVTKKKVGAILVRNGFLAYRDLVDAILTLAPDRIANELVTKSRIPPDLLDEYEIILTAETPDELFVGTGHEERVVKEIVQHYYPEKRINFTAFAPDNLDEFVARMRQTGALKNVAGEDEVLNRLLYQAISEGVSDIHIEPKDESYSVFFRHNGVRKHIYEGTIGENRTITAQIKDRSRMDLAERRKSQDGGFKEEYQGKLIDLRVNATPGVLGEKIVIRVLDPDRVQPKLDTLGITRIREWRRGFDRMHGLCLVCGPTGSGKTTTLNATVREIDRFEKAVYTIEDPVEYTIAYTAQVAINEAVGVNFANAIRSFMRGDPDVIVLGEIRDEETARNAVRAAETGHLVLATLHTGDIIGSISRLRDLDVPERQLINLLRSVLVQNLVRTVCPTCHGVQPTMASCRTCNGSGYNSRTVVSECVSMPDPDGWLSVLEGQRSWPTKIDDAMNKVREGTIDMREMKRVFGSSVDEWMEQHPDWEIGEPVR